MPSLRDVQSQMRRSLLAGAGSDAVPDLMIGAGLAREQRWGVYRNTILLTLTNALRVSYPAVNRLVGAEFFDAAACAFIGERPPRCADLNAYGDTFADFLQHLEPAATLTYLPDVARLEWAVNRALHANDTAALALALLAAVDERDHARVCFVAHPAVSLLRSAFRVDAIWRAVLEQDDAAIAAIDVDAGGPVHLIVQRVRGHVAVDRLDARAWRFASMLFEGRPLGEALDSATGIDAPALLARHLDSGCFVAFHLAGGADVPSAAGGTP